jgi:hypothetical protein
LNAKHFFFFTRYCTTPRQRKAMDILLAQQAHTIAKSLRQNRDIDIACKTLFDGNPKKDPL